MKKYIYLLTTILIILISSCAPPAYIPNAVNTPLLSNKGEVQAALHIGTSGFDPQVAYAISEHVGLMLNGSFLHTINDSNQYYHKHEFLELGVGYYTKIGNIGRFETFGGFGLGNLKTNSKDFMTYNGRYNTYFLDVKSSRAFIQPTIGISNSIFDGSFTPRLVMVNINEKSLMLTNYFIEPTFTAKVGYKYVKFIFQIGISIPIDIHYKPFKNQAFNISIGLRGSLFRDY